MTKSEFLDYVLSFHKTAGNYTNDEIYQIGMEHKKLLKEEKNWTEVGQLIGWVGTGESLRSFVNSRMRREGILPKNNKVLTDKTVEEVSGDDLVKLKEDLIKQQQKTRDEWTTYRSMLREDSRIDSLKDAVKFTVDRLNKLPKVAYTSTKKTKNPKEAILMLSDLHIGVNCDNFYNTYNVAVATKRLEKVVNDTIKYCTENNVETLNVINLGDMIHGLIHTNARIDQEIDTVDQIMVASELVASTLNSLQKAAPKIIYRSVIDNHSRAVADKHQAIESENFNKIMNWFLQERLKNTDIMFKFDNIDDGIGKFTLKNGKKVMFAHGHQDNINQAFQHFVGASKEFIDYVLLAHYHSEKAKTYNGIKVIVNGSIVGTEQYALSKRLFGTPSQTLLIFDGFNLLNISLDLSE